MENKSNLLLTPSAKKSNQFKREYPFPIVTSTCKEGESDDKWKIAVGYLLSNCVRVHDEESIKLLYNMGFFGKGTLSKHAPQMCLNKNKSAPKENQKKESAKESPEDVEDVIDVVDSDDESSRLKKIKISNEDEVMILSDTEEENKSEKECLQLSFEEAFFLSYGLGCLIVKSKDRYFGIPKLWTTFCELTHYGDFPATYTAYHHFRSKGWIVKSGIKYGADFVLYKDGPPFYHATYSVVVQTLKENLRLKVRNGNREFTWSSLAALNRVNNTAGKGLLFLYVIKPNNISESSPLCISQFKLEEVLFKRWVPSENRKEDELFERRK
ncbi:tRNA-splicing endonuclease subunit Sen2 [Caerostris extrusa]|uniref:tRNA-splicing endonuclease subunit Sen2 n=1 Tax=Caerostris extrusa TaxID=172846 RepID=A0AAV4PAM9_CAEEX|nr:tRNA-splicing endonuclease subunit Sen2 [Caerostris extrusa]